MFRNCDADCIRTKRCTSEYIKVDDTCKKWNTKKILKQACLQGNMYIVKFAANWGIPDWNCGLSGACEGGHHHLVEFMIEMGADDWTGGFCGACEEGHIDIVKLMIDHEGLQKGATAWKDGLF